MIFLIDPNSTFLERSNILLESPELDAAGPETPGVGDDDDVPLPVLGGGQGHDLLVRLPLGDEETVAAVDEDPDQVPGSDAKILPPNGDLGSWRTFSGGHPTHHGRWSHGSGM